MNLNDIVRVGDKGKTDYLVIDTSPDESGRIQLRSTKTGKTLRAEPGRLVVQPMAEWEKEVLSVADEAVAHEDYDKDTAHMSTEYVREILEEKSEPAPEVPQPSTYSLAILVAMNGNDKQHVYAGTVPEKVKAKRRAKNRVARRSRRTNRRQAARA